MHIWDLTFKNDTAGKPVWQEGEVTVLGTVNQARQGKGKYNYQDVRIQWNDPANLPELVVSLLLEKGTTLPAELIGKQAVYKVQLEPTAQYAHFNGIKFSLIIPKEGAGKGGQRSGWQGRSGSGYSGPREDPWDRIDAFAMSYSKDLVVAKVIGLESLTDQAATIADWLTLRKKTREAQNKAAEAAKAQNDTGCDCPV